MSGGKDGTVIPGRAEWEVDPIRLAMIESTQKALHGECWARAERVEKERDEALDKLAETEANLAETEEHLSNTQSNYIDAGAYAERMLQAFAQAESRLERVRNEVVNQGNLGAMTRTAQDHILAILDEARGGK